MDGFCGIYFRVVETSEATQESKKTRAHFPKLG